MTRAYSRKVVHGTVKGYIYWACRCEACLQAVRDYYGHKPRAVWLAEVEPPHGTESRYTSEWWRCRCRACKDASNAAKRQRRKTGNVNIHGAGGYSNGCRCDICNEGRRVYQRSLRARKKETA